MNKIDEITKILTDMNDEMAELKAKYQQKAQDVFKVAFKEFFSAYPQVTAIGWRQYTPYFNDGDACVFQCGASYGWATNAEDYGDVRYGEYEGDEDGVWVDDGDYGDFNADLIPKDVAAALQELRNLLGKVDDDVFLDMFGDHVQVIATPEGFEVEEYDHD